MQSDADPSMYLQHNSDGEVVAAVLIYVDNLQLASKVPGLDDSLSWLALERHSDTFSV